MNQRGFTLLEVLVSVMLFGLVMAGMHLTLVGHLTHNARAERKGEAIAAAQRKLDDLRQTNPQTMPASGTYGPEEFTVGDRVYEVTTSYCSDSSLCTTINNRHISVEVSYLGKTLYEVETVYTKLK